MKLSISRLNMLIRCGCQYEFRYVRGIIAPPGAAIIVGKGTHRANASDLLNKMDAGELLPDEQVKQLAAETTAKEWDAQEVALDEEEKDRGVEKVRGESIDKAVTLASLYHSEVAPSIEPLAIEAGFSIPVAGVHELVGYKDIETPTHVRDTKTTGKSPDKEAANNSLQLTAYLWESSLRGQPKAGALDYLVASKTPKLMQQETTRGPEDFAALERRLSLAADVINGGAFAPCDPTSWCCSAKWCGYWHLCEFGQRGRSRK